MLCRQNLTLGLFALISGVVVFLWAEKIQEIGIRSRERHPKVTALILWADFIRKPEYRLVIRASGLFVIGVSILVFYAAWKACSAQ
jgi:hypothetical protein